jgi:hypothetical protein
MSGWEWLLLLLALRPDAAPKPALEERPHFASYSSPWNDRLREEMKTGKVRWRP